MRRLETANFINSGFTRHPDSALVRRDSSSRQRLERPERLARHERHHLLRVTRFLFTPAHNITRHSNGAIYHSK